MSTKPPPYKRDESNTRTLSYYGLISSGENSVQYLQLTPFTIHHLAFHQVPITAGTVQDEKIAQHLCKRSAAGIKPFNLECEAYPHGYMLPHNRSYILHNYLLVLQPLLSSVVSRKSSVALNFMTIEICQTFKNLQGTIHH